MLPRCLEGSLLKWWSLSTATRLQQSKMELSTSLQRTAKRATLNLQVKTVQKIFGKRITGSKKRWFPTSDSHQPGGNASNDLQVGAIIKPTKYQSKQTLRRVMVLNKLFMSHITDMLATGAVAPNICGRGLQVSRVKVAPDFAVVNVFWYAGGQPEHDAQLEKELQQCSGRLRHELSQLRLMGEVPRIQFVRDRVYANMTQVEALLTQIDLGPDYKANSREDRVRGEFFHNFEEDVDDVVDDDHNGGVGDGADGDENLSEDSATATIPKMRQDVLGLNHREIMFKILTKTRKSKKAWEMYENGATTPPPSIVEGSTGERTLFNQINQKLSETAATSEDFEKFLLKRRINKDMKESKKHRHHNQIIEAAAAAAVDPWTEERYASMGANEEEDYVDENDEH